MSNVSDSKRCPKCGGPISAEAPQGLCPKCLLQQACVPTEAGKGESAKAVPPTLEELAAAFPQLEILQLIGQGGMGFVFQARQPTLDRFVALKILPQSLAADPAFAERFTREGRMLARLNHPNIVALYEFGRAELPLGPNIGAAQQRSPTGPTYFFLMEYVDGVNLRQAMKVGRFTPAQALSIVPKICEALQFAHNEGILHRDIKPENILLDTKGRVKIADFGIAKMIGSEPGRAELPLSPGIGEQHSPTGIIGTPQYMAPEQLEHPQDVDQRADIYSLGVVFYEMLTGELPIGRFAPPSEKSAVDPRVDEVVLRALEKEREKRYRTAGEVKTQVETIAGTPPAGSSRREEVQIYTSATLPPRSRRRRWKVAGVVGAVGLLVLAIQIAILLPAYFRAGTRPEIHYRVFEVESAVADKLVPVAQRQNGATGNWQVSDISPETLAALLDGRVLKKHIMLDRHLLVPISKSPSTIVTRTPGVKEDQRQVVVGWPVVSDSWGHSLANHVSEDIVNVNGHGFFGVRRKDGVLQLKIERVVTHKIGDRPAVDVNIAYEGNAPQTGALAFFIPFARRDNTTGYFLLTVEVHEGTTEAELAKQARAFVENLAAGRTADAVARFDMSLTTRWPENDVKEWWHKHITHYGKLLRTETPMCKKGPFDTQRVTLMCIHEKGRCGLRISFFPSGMIEGVKILPQGTGAGASETRP